MDACEATNVVMGRIQKLDPENASKIMGFILLQDQGEKEMIRLAFVPDGLLLSCINQVKFHLGLSSNISSAISIRPSNSNAFPPRIMVPSSTNEISNNGSPRLRFYGGGGGGGGGDLDENSIFDQMISPSGRSDSLRYPYGEDAHSPHPFHRRSCSVNDAVFVANMEEGGGGGNNGVGFRPCMYFARGFCKNGGSCKFLHSENGGGEGVDVGSVSPTGSGLDEYLRMKAVQQQRLAGGGGGGGGHHSFGYNKSVNILNDNQRCGPRNGFSQMGLAASLSLSSRQIYLTFPADSTFEEEDVSSHFSIYGPVQDVRIPYQPKRMFGFVTFVYPETVKIILAKGNPHYVCDSRVLVKPYKEKGKIPEKKQMQQQHEHLERGEYSACLSPPGVDSRDIFDVPNGSRMPFSPQEMMLRRKLEQEAELQHVLELQSRRVANLQLGPQSSPRFLPHLFPGFQISSQRQQQLLMSQNFLDSPNATHQDVLQEFDDGREALNSPAVAADDDSYLPESMAHILPDNLFSSPTKVAAEQRSVFSSDADNNITVTNTSSNNAPVVASSSPLRLGSLFYSGTKRYI